jgi:hypothetical protein
MSYSTEKKKIKIKQQKKIFLHRHVQPRKEYIKWVNI